jgi:hypothetical protein
LGYPAADAADRAGKAECADRIPTPQGAGVAVIATSLISAVTGHCACRRGADDNSDRRIWRDTVHRGRGLYR